MKRYLLSITLLLAICSFAASDNTKSTSTGSVSMPSATCTGAKDCKACKNCKYCKHCAEDKRTCGVCKKM